ncbi:MAG: hypothetical protein IGS38_06885 [Synechococcales cyanobacterium M58_A2018_015]|nr:hypothetical protein [Synechococcales cyanobacterium M58_A2018_015]
MGGIEAAWGQADMPWGFNQSMLDRFWESLTAPIWDWLNQYPVLYWLMLHPIWLLVTLVTLLFLLSGLLGAIARLTERLWLAILRSPITLMQWIWRGSLFLLSRLFAAKSTAVHSVSVKSSSTLGTASLTPSTSLTSQVTSQDRLTEVLNRLEVLRQEQDELLREVKLLLGTQSVSR